jgi:hypothetical protein
MAHTKGPWTIGYGGKPEDDYAVIVSPFSPRAICILEPEGYSPDNARLIASAPDLLEAAKKALAEMSLTSAPRNSFTDAVDALDEAIAKATRKQAIGTAKGIIAEMQHGPGATHANMGDAWFEPNESDPGEMEEYESGPLAAARGCIISTLIGLSMWAVVGWGLYEWLK